jgi:hypothetical protein
MAPLTQRREVLKIFITFTDIQVGLDRMTMPYILSLQQ